ncbi:ribonuclease H protein [Dorcoceras hygrometricum]|uniref:Ribonuclease H protein n=1 Tax=Dorcoceras hygrometricum TaxID=472368 RepID=A0A2Z7CRX3_9LAMI|nr:ribonuclease H protein [Dorcoceras hygrometricum]
MAKGAIVKRKSQSKKKSDSSEKATGEAQVEVIFEKFVSRKRPNVAGDDLVVTKKKRTSKSKASSSKTSTAMVTVAQDAVPLQIFEPTPAATAEQPPIPKRKSKKRRLVLSDDENIEERVDVETVENVQQHVIVEEPIVEHNAEEERHVSTHEGTITDDVDVIIGNVLAETSQFETIEGEQGEQHFDETANGDIASGSSLVDQSDNLEQWFEDFVSRDAETVFTSNSDLDRGTEIVGTVSDEEQLQVFVEKETVEKSAGSNPTDEEQLSLDDLLMQISDDMMLPSVTAAEITKIMSDLPVKIKKVQEHDWYYANLPEISATEKGKAPLEEADPPVKIKKVQEHDWYYANLPEISATEKGKAPLEEADPVKGNPAREMVELICADVNFLVKMRDQGNDYWRSSCRLSIFVNRKRFPERIIEEDFVPHGYFIEPVQYWGAAPSIIKSCGLFRVCLDLFGTGQATNSFVNYFSDSDVQQGFNSTPDIDSVSSDCSTVYRSPSPQHDSFPFFQEAETEPSVHRESSSVSSVLVSDPNAQVDMVQRQDSQIPIVDSPMRFNSDDLSLDDIANNQFSLPAVTTELSAFLMLSGPFYHSVLIIRQRILGKLMILKMMKGVLAHSASVTADLVDVRKELKGLNAKVTYLDEQVATIRSELLDFRAKAEENYLNLSTQLGDIVDYLRGGDAKKGESSSSRPQPPPDDQDRPT